MSLFTQAIHYYYYYYYLHTSRSISESINEKVFFPQRLTVTGILWQKQQGGHISCRRCFGCWAAGPGLWVGLRQGAENKVQSILKAEK